MISKRIDSCSKNTPYANLRSVIKPLYIIMSLLGLFPYSVQLHSKKPGFTPILKSIYLNFMCALFYVVIIVLFLVLHIRHLSEASKESALTEAIMTELNYIIEMLNIFIFCAVAYVCVYRDRLKYLKTLNTISNLIETSNIDKERILKRLHRRVSIVLVSLSFLLVMQMAVNFSRNDGLFKIILVMMTYNVPQMIQFTSIAFFHVLIITVIEMFRCAREEILTTSTEKITTVTNGLTNVVSRHRKLTLREIEFIYIEAFKVKQDVNKMFEAPILITLIQCFHSIVSESHIIYHGVVIQMNFSIHEIVNCSIWIIYQILKIYAIANAGNLFKLEVIKLCRSIHIIPREKQELRFFIEVQHFSAMMSFPDKELTVFGYFSLDASLIFKVIASAGMYVIILVQFDKTP